MRAIRADALADELDAMLRAYVDTVKYTVDKLTRQAADDCVSELRRTSPARTGGYAKGWKRSRTKWGYAVHNTEYRRTHLLEDGHMNRDGTRTGGTAHIGPAATHAAQAFVKNLKGEIGG